jgi:diguanylate cyclase (GGDEF)-like protein
MRMSAVQQVVIVHSDGLPFASAARAQVEAPSWKHALARLIVGDHERIVRQLVMPSLDPAREIESVGSLIVVLDESVQADSYIRMLLASLGVSLLGAFLVVAVVVVLFDRFLTRPILSISRQVEGVDAEDPHGRMLAVPKWHVGSELGQAVQKINAMLIHLGNAQHALRRMATRDATTNLPNRTLTIEHLVGVARRSPQGKVAAVLAVLMDRLDEVKDLIGHEEADEMALDMAVRLLDAVGEEAFVGRIGVDSFAVVIEGLDSVTSAVDYADRLLNDLTRVEPGDERGFGLRVCIGSHAMATPSRHATHRRRRAVAQGRWRPPLAQQAQVHQERWNFFEDGLAEGAHRRCCWKASCSQALESDEFIL